MGDVEGSREERLWKSLGGKLWEKETRDLEVFEGAERRGFGEVLGESLGEEN